jgi:hypothetical protein
MSEPQRCGRSAKLSAGLLLHLLGDAIARRGTESIKAPRFGDVGIGTPDEGFLAFRSGRDAMTTRSTKEKINRSTRSQESALEIVEASPQL